MDISNGENIGIVLFVQGCHFKCHNCFNPETWDFNGGKQWTQETKGNFLSLIDKPYIKRITILGGEPLAEENLEDVLDLISDIRFLFPLKSIWIYTGYEWEHIFDQGWHYHPRTQEKLSIGRWKRQQIISQCNVLIDGQYIDTQRDITAKWKGSKNQRVIHVQRTIRNGEIVLWTT